MQVTIGQDIPIRSFGFDAVDRSNRRKPFPTTLRTEDAELNAEQRRRLQSGPRDLYRNFEIAGWMVRRHLDFVSRFSFRADTGDDAKDEFLEAKVKDWGSKSRCEVTGRLNLGQMVRMQESLKVLGGDLLVVKLATGHVQIVEGDKIKNPKSTETSPNVLTKNTVDGVELDAFGKAAAYHVWKRATGSTMEYDRKIPAANAWHLAYLHRYDQVRGFSPLAAGLNRLRDIYECVDYAIAKAKLAQIFGIAIYSEDPDDDDAANHDFTKGPVQLNLDRDDKAEFLESKNPSMEFQGFLPSIISIALKALDIPFSFFDEAYTNYSGQRQGLLNYDESCKVKRCENIDFLDDWLRWRLTLAQLDGELEGYVPEDFQWVWNSIGIPWIDPLKEREADVVAVEACMGSRQSLLKRRGEDFWQILRELEQEKTAINDAGLTAQVNYQPAPQAAEPPKDKPTNNRRQDRRA